MPNKYDYSALKAQLQMLAAGSGATDISKLRVFYPKAGWTELRAALNALAEADPSVSYDEKTHKITVS